MIQKNLNALRQTFDGNVVTLVAVSKTKPDAQILEAYHAQQRIFGENYVQELVEKHDRLPHDIAWHFIGHLQSNKVKYIVPFVSLIHSVDSLKLLVEIDKQAKRCGRVVDCLLQIYIAQEETKFGFEAEEILHLIDKQIFTDLTNINVIGLMAMASNTTDVEQLTKEFLGAKALFDRLGLERRFSNFLMRELSIGMSSDCGLAIACGSTMIRVGSAIFGQRNYIV